jgi:hypothetical protein
LCVYLYCNKRWRIIMNEIGQRIASQPMTAHTAAAPVKKENTETAAQPQDQVSVGKHDQSIYESVAQIPGKALKIVAGMAFGALNTIPHAAAGAMAGMEIGGDKYAWGTNVTYMHTSNTAHLAQGAVIGTMVGGLPGAIIGGLAGAGWGILTTNLGFGPTAVAADDATYKTEREMDGKSYQGKLAGVLEGGVRGAFHGAVEGFTMFLGKKD